MTDEIKTVLSTTFTSSPHPPESAFPSTLPPSPLRMLSPPEAAVTGPQWLNLFALASHSCTEARKASSEARDWSEFVLISPLLVK